MGKKSKAPKFDSEKARELGATWHDTDSFAAVTIPADGFDKLIRIVRNGRVWVHKDFRK